MNPELSYAPWIGALYLVHVSCAFISIAGFGLRGYWMVSGDPRLQHRLARVLPHIVDTVLLGSALGMLVILRLSPLATPWLMAKIIALLCYIGLGMIALRLGKTRKIRVAAWLLALLTALYIVAVAYSKSPLGLLAAFV
jgi:uncharacterized membrane protein SirB2